MYLKAEHTPPLPKVSKDEVSGRPMASYPVGLADGTTAVLWIPMDLSAMEARRLSKTLNALVMSNFED